MAKEYTTYDGWIRASKRLAKRMNAEKIVVTGDKDIGEAFLYRKIKGVGCVRLIGEWDGASGFSSTAGRGLYEGDLAYANVIRYGKEYSV